LRCFIRAGGRLRPDVDDRGGEDVEDRLHVVEDSCVAAHEQNLTGLDRRLGPADECIEDCLFVGGESLASSLVISGLEAVASTSVVPGTRMPQGP
jgi:hypothetical protein